MNIRQQLIQWLTSRAFDSYKINLFLKVYDELQPTDEQCGYFYVPNPNGSPLYKKI